jgi:hypothetical protein
MLGGLDEDGLAHERGRIANLGDVAAGGGNFKVVQIGAAEDDAGAGGGGNEPHGNLGATVEADPLKANFGSDCLLEVSGTCHANSLREKITSGTIFGSVEIEPHLRA